MMSDDGDDGEDSNTEDPGDQLLNRGAFLRQLREMERQDEAERAAAEEAVGADIDGGGDTVRLSTGDTVLRYDCFLKKQRYYDDLKHVDNKYIDFGSFGTTTPLLVEQDKALGKGGLCWDAAFILGEHMLNSSNIGKEASQTKIIELGCGTGLCGLMIAKAAPVHVTLTDLPNLLPLLRRNTARNFPDEERDPVSEVVMDEYVAKNRESPIVRGSASASVLCWGDKEQEALHGKYDIILGADVVATLYDPCALAETIYNLSHGSTKVFISFKERLSTIHRHFEAALRDRFASLRIVKPLGSRNHNPAVQIIVAESRRETCLTP